MWQLRSFGAASGATFADFRREQAKYGHGRADPESIAYD